MSIIFDGNFQGRKEMAKEGWLKFRDLMIPENKIVAVTRKKNKIKIHLQGGHEFSLSKSEGNAYWQELGGDPDPNHIELIEIEGS